MCRVTILAVIALALVSADLTGKYETVKCKKNTNKAGTHYENIKYDFVKKTKTAYTLNKHTTKYSSLKDCKATKDEIFSFKFDMDLVANQKVEREPVKFTITKVTAYVNDETLLKPLMGACKCGNFKLGKTKTFVPSECAAGTCPNYQPAFGKIESDADGMLSLYEQHPTKEAAAEEFTVDKELLSQAMVEVNDKYGEFCVDDSKDCTDADSHCPKWANDGECTKNPEWMLNNCPNSCCPVCTRKNVLKTGSCPTEENKALCVPNTHSHCHKWQEEGECEKNKKWMLPNCMESCCEVCKVGTDECPTVKETCATNYVLADPKDDETAEGVCKAWADRGECKNNPKWMKKNCAQACCPVCVPKAPAKVGTAAPAPRPIQRVQYPVFNQPAFQQPFFGGYQAGFGGYFGR